MLRNYSIPPKLMCKLLFQDIGVYFDEVNSNANFAGYLWSKCKLHISILFSLLNGTYLEYGFNLLDWSRPIPRVCLSAILKPVHYI